MAVIEETRHFTDLPYVAPSADVEAARASDFASFREMNIGYGSKCFRADNQGIWLGASKYASAPFRVDMSGNVYASSITLTGYVAVGGAAADVNSGVTTISGGKITAYSITADRIVVGTFIQVGGAAGDVNAGVTTINGGKLTTGTVTADYVVASISISSPTITGGSIAIGSGNSIFKADSNGIYLGNATFGSAPFRVNMSGAVTASSLTLTNASIGSGSSYTGNQINEAYIGTLSASKISTTTLSAIVADLGTITAGTLKVSSSIGIQKSDGTAVAYLGQDPDSAGLWGFIANRGYGLMCKYTSSNYFRVYMDGSSTDAIIDLPSPDKLKIQGNGGGAIARFYGAGAGWLTSLGGLDMFGGLQLYNASAGLAGCGSTNKGMMFYNTTYDEVWVWRYNGATYEWKALAYVP